VPSVQEHLTQWAHNRRFLQRVEPAFSDWIVTAALYTALHAIEALFTADGTRSRSSHKDRLLILQSANRYDLIYRKFRVLYDLAHVTRYSATPGRWMPAEQLHSRVIVSILYPIENSVRRLLAQQSVPIVMDDPGKIILMTGDNLSSAS
jgi:hypothetical protein